MPVSGGAAVLTDALRLLDAARITLDDVGLRRPTLDDVFLALTGHVTRQTGGPESDARNQSDAPNQEVVR
jgi:ABC-2 type transport system ATP-binding protein